MDKVYGSKQLVTLIMGETAIQKPPTTLLEVWESLPEGTNCQIIKNKLTMSPAPLDNHQEVLLSIATKIFIFLEKQQAGVVRISPYDVHFDQENIYQPDIFYVAKENLHKIKGHFYGAPDLIIEVLSPSNANYDKVDKKEIYEKYAVKEYFIVEPTDKSVISYFLVNDEFVQRESKPGVLESKLLGTTFTF